MLDQLIVNIKSWCQETSIKIERIDPVVQHNKGISYSSLAFLERTYKPLKQDQDQDKHNVN